MEDKVQVKLLEDIYSGSKGKKLYGRKNETVNLINILGNVLIVERENKFKFAVRIELTDY